MSSTLAVKRPQYFHLLWDEELDRLRDVLHMLRDRHSEVLDRWYQLYTVHLGEAATLSRREFYALYGRDLTQTNNHLLQGGRGITCPRSTGVAITIVSQATAVLVAAGSCSAKQCSHPRVRWIRLSQDSLQYTNDR